MSTQATVEQIDTPTTGNPTATQPNKYQGFLRRQAQEEAELAELEAARNAPEEPTTPEVPDEELSAEEKTYKKRYGDLRSHTEKLKNAHKSELEAAKEEAERLRRQLEKSTEIPATEEELATFMNDRPDFARILETIVAKRINAATEDFSKKFQKLDEDKKANAEERARLNLLKVHPDLNELQESDDFHAWLATKPLATQRNVYDNPEDWEAAADVITLYKYESGKQKKPGKGKAQEDAAANVRVPARSSEPGEPSKYKFSESQIARMTDKEFEKNEMAISEAMQRGEVLMDISGAAR